MNTLEEKLALFNPTLPLAQASTIPPLWYFDEEIYQREADSVFSRNWVWVGNTSDLREPGSYVTTDILGEPILLSRTKEDKLVALSNVCRHRGAKVVTAEKGKATSFQCRYHGWNYDLQGALKGIPQFEGVENFEKEKNCLPTFEVSTWGPAAFVRLKPGTQTLEEFLSPVTQQSGNLDLARFQFARRTEYVMDCNWKVFVDNYLDGGYHVQTLHKGLAGVLDDSKYRTDIFEKSSLQSSPLKQDQVGVAAVRSGDMARYWWVFPNLMINIYDSVMDFNIVQPMGVNQCRVIFEYYFTNTFSGSIENSIEVAHQVQLEDQEICEHVQRGLKSQFYKAGRFSVKREAPGYHFHKLMAKTLSS